MESRTSKVGRCVRKGEVRWRRYTGESTAQGDEGVSDWIQSWVRTRVHRSVRGRLQTTSFRLELAKDVAKDETTPDVGRPGP